MQARKRALTRTQIGQHLDLAIPVSRAVRKYSSVFKPPCLWFSFMAARADWYSTTSGSGAGSFIGKESRISQLIMLSESIGEPWCVARVLSLSHSAFVLIQHWVCPSHWGWKEVRSLHGAHKCPGLCKCFACIISCQPHAILHTVCYGRSSYSCFTDQHCEGQEHCRLQGTRLEKGRVRILRIRVSLPLFIMLGDLGLGYGQVPS